VWRTAATVALVFFFLAAATVVRVSVSLRIYLFFWARLLLCACRLIALVCLVCAGWFRPLTGPGSRHESGLLPYARTGAKNTQVWSATQLCLEERPCGRMQREEPTHRKGDLSLFFFLFCVCYQLLYYNARLHQSAEAAIASAVSCSSNT